MEGDREGGGSRINALGNVHSLQILWQEAHAIGPGSISGSKDTGQASVLS